MKKKETPALAKAVSDLIFMYQCAVKEYRQINLAKQNSPDQVKGLNHVNNENDLDQTKALNHVKVMVLELAEQIVVARRMPIIEPGDQKLHQRLYKLATKCDRLCDSLIEAAEKTY